MNYIKIIIAAVIMSGCTVSGPQRFSPDQSRSRLALDMPSRAVEQSLFSSDAAVLSDADIERILAYEYRPPGNAKVAVMGLGQQVWMGFSDELARSGERIRAQLSAALEGARSVDSAEFLPALLIPSSRSVAYFREAAARAQSDLLLVYQSSCRTYEKFRFLQASQSKAFCTVEAVLLDIRTGIVPFTSTSTKVFMVTKSDSDSNLYETRRRAELAAVGEAVEAIGSKVAHFLDGG